MQHRSHAWLQQRLNYALQDRQECVDAGEINKSTCFMTIDHAVCKWRTIITILYSKFEQNASQHKFLAGFFNPCPSSLQLINISAAEH